MGNDFKETQDNAQKMADENQIAYNKLKQKTEAKYTDLKEHDESGKAKYNSATIKNKAMLESLLAEYEQELGNDRDDLNPIFDVLHDYVKINQGEVTVANSRQERKKYNEALDMLNSYSDNIFEKINSGKGDALTQSDNLDKKMEMVANLTHYLEVTAKGALEASDNAVHLDFSGGKTSFVHLHDAETIDKRNAPLFNHDPSFEDIQQGRIGDCYFVSSLSKIAGEMPDKIREAMVDNDDGTVTVRLFGKGPLDPNNPTAPRDLKPVYVTVDKEIPDSGSATDTLWVQLFERAYAASGLRMGTAKSGEVMPENINELYEDYKAGRKPIPSHLDCPWLVNPDGTLHKWEPNYSDIVAGHSSDAIEALLGDEYRGAVFGMGGYIKEKLDTGSAGLQVRDQFDVWANGMKKLFTDKDPNWVDDKMLFSKRGYRSPNMSNLMLAICEYSTGKSLLSVEEVNDLSRGNDIYSPKVPTEWQTIAINMSTYFGMYGEYSKEQSLQSFIGDGLKKLCDDLQKKDYTKLFQGLKEEEIQNITADETVMQRLEEIATYVKDEGEAIKHTQYSGVYNKVEDDIWDMLNDAVHNDCIVNAGTEGKSAIEGVASTHAYSMVDIYTKKVGEKELRFVKMRNPWGEQKESTDPVYIEDENHNMKISCEKHPSDGTFELELSDFMSAYNNVYINGKQEYIKPYKEANQVTNPFCDEKAVLEYEKLIQELDEELKTTNSIFSSDSDEYKDMAKEFSALRRTALGFYGDGKGNISSQMGEVAKKANAYLKHCKEDKKLFSPRRDHRMKIAQAIVHLKDVATNVNEKDFTNPKIELSANIASSLYKSMLESSKLSKDAVNKRISGLLKANEFNVIDGIMKNDEFKKIVDSVSYAEGFSLCGKKSADLLNMFSNVKLDYNKLLTNQPEKSVVVENQVKNNNQEALVN